MQLTQHTDYALRTLIFLLSRPGELVGTRTIAEFYRISPDHLMKVAKSLTQAGWLVSSRGAAGGIKLAPHTADAKVGDIVRHTENLDLVECFDVTTNTCPIHQRCRLKSLLYQAREAFLIALDSCTVRELAVTPLLRTSVGTHSGNDATLDGDERPPFR